MLSNERKEIIALRSRSVRQKKKQFTVEGLKIISTLFQSHKYTLKKIFVAKHKKEFFLDSFQHLVSCCQYIKLSELKQISSLQHPNDALALFQFNPSDPSHGIETIKPPSLILDKVQDPKNLGNVIRICAWFNIHNLLLIKGCTDPLNPKTLQGSMGTSGFLNIMEINVEDLSKLNGKIYGLSMEGENILSHNLDPKGHYVFGNESNGIAVQTKDFIDQFIAIPKLGFGESLNIANSVAIFCSKFIPNKLNKKP